MKNNFYANKKRWKWALAIVALLIIGASLWYTNHLVKSIAEQEKIEMPSFFGYMIKFSLIVLLPVYIIVQLLFI